MTTIKDVKRLTKPLCDQNPDLMLCRRRVVVQPTHHVVRCIEITQWNDGKTFSLLWYACFLCLPKFVVQSLHERLSAPSVILWDKNRPGVEEELCAVVEARALPRLRKVQSLDDYGEFLQSFGTFPYHIDKAPDRAVWFYSAQGDIAKALAIAETLVEEVRGLPDSKLYRQAVVLRNELYPLLRAGDRAGISALLHRIEAETAHNNWLEKAWEPSPFPIDLGA